MYEDFYQFSGRPFQLTPDPRFYFDSRTHRKAMAYLRYGLNQGEGFIIITGDIGTGKTTLVGHLFDELDPERYVFAKVVTTQLDADNLLRAVADAFGIQSEKREKSGLLRDIQTFLKQKQNAGKRVLLIIDEVQNLPISALEELRMLSNFQQGDRALMQSFLLGQPEFRDKLAQAPELEQLRQRVIATHHLEPMDREELEGYVHHRMTRVGWKGVPQFQEDALDAIYEYSGGVPRRLNTLCSRLLLFGAIEELTRFDRKVVEEVIADLEKDQTPTSGPTYGARTSNGTGRGGDTPGYIASGGGYAEVLELRQRLDVLERHVRVQGQTIEQLFQLLERWAKAGNTPAQEKRK